MNCSSNLSENVQYTKGVWTDPYITLLLNSTVLFSSYDVININYLQSNN